MINKNTLVSLVYTGERTSKKKKYTKKITG